MGYKSDDEFQYNPSTGEAVLTRNWHDGTTSSYKGESALANYDGPEGKLYRKLNPMGAYSLKRTNNDLKDSIAYKLGNGLHNYAESPSKNMFSRLMGDNALQSAAVLGGTGLLGGLASNWILKKLGLADDPKMHWIGGLGGLALGGLVGHLRGAAANNVTPPGGMYKMAAMYKDPRNFILEKLQSARDLSMSEKAQLAAQVRRMDRAKADRLSGMVRAAVGFGVGAIIAKFFGLNRKGTVLGGMAGVLGAGVLTALRRPGGFGF